MPFLLRHFINRLEELHREQRYIQLTARTFSECYIGIPSKGEQKKIATLLRLIDERISTQNKIIDKLQSLIKGIMVELQKQGQNKGNWRNVLLVKFSRKGMNVTLTYIKFFLFLLVKVLLIK